MINIGHSPVLLKNIFLWLWHEANLNRKDVEYILEEKGMKINRTTMYLWLNDVHKASWLGWQEKIKGLQEVLADHGMNIQDFNCDRSYTPDNLRELRESSGLSLDEFAEVAGIPPQDLLVYESHSSINTKGLSYHNYKQILKKIECKMS